MKIKDFCWYMGVLVIDAHGCSDRTFQGWGTCGHHLLYRVEEEGISILLYDPEHYNNQALANGVVHPVHVWVVKKLLRSY